MALLSKLKLTAKAAQGLRSRVYRDVGTVVVLFLTFEEQSLGHEVDTHIAGLHLPVWLVFPGGAAIIATVVSWLGAKVGVDPGSTLFTGLFAKTKAAITSQAVEVTPPTLTEPASVQTVDPTTVIDPRPDPPVLTAPDAAPEAAGMPVAPRPGVFAPDPAEAQAEPEAGDADLPAPDPAVNAALAAAMTATYSGTPGVVFSETPPPEPQGPHGANAPGETDGAPDPGEPEF